MGPTHPHYLQALELGKEARAGPGLMDAATKGAMQAGKPVGGFKISKEAGEWTATNFHPYLPSETYLTCRSAMRFFMGQCGLEGSVFSSFQP
ncbi:hypothetical protein CsSME_00026090 [Camellia sinensis var. sinensis]